MEGKRERLGDAVLDKHARGENEKKALQQKTLGKPATHCGYLHSYILQPNTIKIGDKPMSSTTSYLKISVTLEVF